MSPRTRSILGFVGLAAGTAVTAVYGATVTRRGMNPWYRLLRKPKGNPPDALFRPVWTALFVLSTASAWRVFRSPPTPARSRALALWGAQLLLNGNWSRLFFGKHRADAALVDLLLLTTAVAAYLRQARSIDHAAGWMMAPYVGWLGYATYLNEQILVKNPKALVAGGSGSRRIVWN